MRKRSRIRLPILSRISARSPPVCRCRITAVTKNLRSRLGTRSHMRVQAFFQGDAEVLLLEDAAELLADRGGHFRGDHVEAEGQALPGAERAGHHLQGVGQLGGEGLQPLAAAEQQPHQRQAAQGNRRPAASAAGWSVQRRSPGRSRPRPAPPRSPPACSAVSDVSACSNSTVDVAEPLEAARSSSSGPSSSGWARTLASFNRPSLAAAGVSAPVSRSRRSSMRWPGFLQQRASRRRRRGRRPPRTPSMPISSGLTLLVLQHHPLAEGAGGQPDAGRLQPRHERRPHAGGDELAVGPAVSSTPSCS